MAKLIEANDTGVTVYGVKQYSYTVEGEAGRDYMAALSAASFKESVALEKTAGAYAEVVRQRNIKLDELGNVMAVLSRAMATLKVKEQEPGDQSDSMYALVTAAATAAKYGVTISISGTRIRRDNAMRAQNAIQYAIDREDNELKQDLVSLQSYVTKRDNSFSTASKLVKKVNGSASATINNIGA